MIGGILCGGYGKRLKPLTDHTPKPLIEIKENYTILDKQLFQFYYAGVKKVYFLAGYLSDRIQKKYGKKWKDIKIEYLIETEPKGTLFGINSLLKIAKDDVVIRNGDIVCDINLKEMIKNHKKGEVTMFTVPLRSPYGIVDFHLKKISSFQEKPMLPYYINGGIYIISQKSFPLFLKHKEGDVEQLVFPDLAKNGFLNAYREENIYWVSVDSLKDLEDVLKEYENKIDKPWGYEKIIILSEKYLTKELYIMKDESTSYQYHNKKDETIHLQRGKLLIKFENNEVVLKPNDRVRIKPKEKHQLCALENSLIYEYSTPHLNDTVRVSDPYKR